MRLGEYDITRDVDCIMEVDGLDCADPPVDAEVQNIMVHPSYDVNSNSKHNDIAILKVGKFKFVQVQ